MAQKKKLCLIDGSGYIFRAFYAFPPMTKSDKTPVNALYGFTAMLMQFVKNNTSDYIVVVFDAKRENFRNEIYDAYKANRKETPPELAPQFPLIREVAPAFNLAETEMEGYEADDLIATYTQKALEKGMEVLVVSSDKDLTQLLQDGVQIYDPMKKKLIGLKEVDEKFGVVPSLVPEVQAIQGDTSDNIPGVKGIGPKGAAKLINEFGSLEGVYEHIDEIKPERTKTLLKESKELAFISKKLVMLDKNAPVDGMLETFKAQQPNFDKMMAFIEKHEFKSLKSRVEQWFSDRKETVCQFCPQAEKKYFLLQTKEEGCALVQKIKKQGKMAFSFLTEKDEVLGVSFACSNDEGYFLAFNEKQTLEENAKEIADKKEEKPVSKPALQGTFLDLLNEKTVLEKEDKSSNKKADEKSGRKSLFSLFEPLFFDTSILKIMHNAKTDFHLMSSLLSKEVSFDSFDDICLMDYAIYGVSQSHHLQDMALHLLEYRPLILKELRDGRKSLKEVPEENLKAYLSERACLIFEMYCVLNSKLTEKKAHTIYKQFDKPLVQVLFEMEKNGIWVNKEALEKLNKIFDEKIEKITEKIYQRAGVPSEINLNSPMQVGKLLFETLDLAKGKRLRKSAQYNTSALELEKLEEAGAEIAGDILEYRQMTKLKTTYILALLKLAQKEERIHTTFLQTVTSTGRLSSIEPNMQNIPVRTEEGRLVRECFAAKEGHILVDADYSQVELRLMSSIGKVKALKEDFEKGLDIHTRTAANVFGLKEEDVTPEIRRHAKAINFGIIYGISEFGLAKNLGIERKEAASYIERYFEKYPEIKTYMDDTIEMARENGYVKTYFGRKCFTSGILNKNQMARKFAERAAINAPIQGTAADIMKLAMQDVLLEMKKRKMKSKLMLQVHDELIFEAPLDEKDELKALVKDKMENAVKLDVPLKVEVGEGKTWKESH